MFRRSSKARLKTMSKCNRVAIRGTTEVSGGDRTVDLFVVDDVELAGCHRRLAVGHLEQQIAGVAVAGKVKVAMPDLVVAVSWVFTPPACSW